MKEFCRSQILLHAGLLLTLCVSAQEASFNGMLAGWFAAGKSNEWAIQLGGRYIPEFDFAVPLNNTINLEGELSANLTGSYTNPAENNSFYGKIKPYRVWAKISGKQYEVRAGLQKINFGSASIIRPLMWFDRLDPRDPLQLTDGVYGVLGRYYTLNNINLWGWGLLGNNSTKGWEAYTTKEGNIEFGGRLQFPVPRAEIGISYHHRKAVETVDIEYPSPATQEIIFPENRLGIDIKADLGIGFWMENVIKHQESDYHYPWTNMLTLGLDYTFGIGNGMRAVAEHLIFQSSNEIFKNGETVHFTAVTADYPFNIFSRLSYIAFYDWNKNKIYNFINLGLTYNRFSYYIIGFLNPAEFGFFGFDSGPTMFRGTGIEIMAVYNY